jgi:hypothetical protein
MTIRRTMAIGMPAIRPGITNANGDGGSSAGVVGPLTRPAPPSRVDGLELPPLLVPEAGAEAESEEAADGSDDSIEGDVDDPGEPPGGGVTVIPVGAVEDVGSGSEETGSEGRGWDGTGRLGTGRLGTGTLGTGRLGTGTLGVGNEGSGRDGNGRDGRGSEGSGRDGNGRDGSGTDGNGRRIDGSGTDGSGTDGSATGRAPATARSTRSMSRRQPTPIAPIAP